MIEYSTKALVLACEDIGEFDKTIYLFTKELGKVKARAKSARKITSKLSGHLQPLNFIRVRLVEKRGLQIADAFEVSQMKISHSAMEFVSFIKEMTFEFQQDKKIWFLIKEAFKDFKKQGKISYKRFLEIMGFSPKFAVCDICKNKFVKFFSQKEQIFLCYHCALPYKFKEKEKKEFPDLIAI
ncbi:DNA repair protein RecO [Candidatus Wolfebacteria bacterium]|nr:DNA repair protein RecO [Candidatus Wolfebacteria bacterium]